MRIVGILVHRAFDAGALQRFAESLRVTAAAVRQKLHEQPLVGTLRLPVPHPAFLAQVGWLDILSRIVTHLVCPAYAPFKSSAPV